ncbi:E3 ubiquitin- ligase SDIR1-like isoform X1 [Brachionus plicatilis]|uniref:E3 ubiquitin-ligase SDIR1-like isoform X1 n=1 Tax=Brachionus plicatilis TaxID=10195 RepID=A0A3M7P2S3_BRAPC|nr:E3 ubiquitin- ligase SDIR1-like isoform X1 [Brachionus plicatilis]
MDIINNKNLDCCLIVPNKSEKHRGYVELLFESNKRTGGDEIDDLIYDAILKQFIIIFKNQKTTDGVLAFGDVNFQNELYKAFRVDRKKFILENIDSNLQNDVINLYIDYLLEAIGKAEFQMQHIKTGFVLIECSQAIDFDSLNKKYSDHNTLQKKTIKFHFVPELDKDLNVLSRVDTVKYFSSILSCSSELHCTISENQAANFAENDSVQETLNASEIFYKEKIKNLEHKLLLYKNLNQSLNQMNFLGDQASDSNGTDSFLSADNDWALSSSCLREPNLVPKECKLLYQDNGDKACKTSKLESDLVQSRCDKKKMIKNFQKFLIGDNKNDGETDKKVDSNSTSKISNRTTQCTFSPLRSKCNPLAQRFPVIKYQRPNCKSYFKPEEETGENSDLETCLNLNIKCSICLEDLLPNENVRILSCFHQFHVKCIDTWLAQKSTCPTCKLDLIISSNE